MAATQHDRIVAAIRDLCLAAPALAVTIEDESQADEMPEGQASSIVVSLLDSQPQKREYAGIRWDTTVRVSCRVRRDEFGADGRPSSLLGAQVFARVMADTTLGGLAETVAAPRISAEFTPLRTRIGVLNLDFTVRHRTSGATLI